eukprot:1146209-Prymnesium_polylepis.1
MHVLVVTCALPVVARLRDAVHRHVLHHGCAQYVPCTPAWDMRWSEQHSREAAGSCSTWGERRLRFFLGQAAVATIDSSAA